MASVSVSLMRRRPIRAPRSALAGVIALLLGSVHASAFDQRYPELLRLALACPEAPWVRKDGGNTITSSTTYSFVDEGRNFSIVSKQTYSVTGVKSKITKERNIASGSYADIVSADTEGNEFDVKCKNEADCITMKMVSNCEFTDCKEGNVFDVVGKTFGAGAVLCDEESAKNAKAAFELLMRERR